MTSFDCIRRLKKLLHRTDIGHAGTLDRFATGLLPVFFGEGLKLTRFFLESYPQLPSYWKTYEGVIALGNATETGDPEGAVTETLPVPELSQERVHAIMQSFVGVPYEQTPPAYSAKKIEGQRASELARKGQTPELKAVSVYLKTFECLGVEGSKVRFRVECSKGTYVRVLAQDLAKKLETAAHLEALRRTRVGTFQVSDAVKLDAVDENTIGEHIRTLQQAVEFLPEFPLLGPDVENLRLGKTADVCVRLANSGLPAGVYCAFAGTSPETKTPVALLQVDENRNAQFLRGLH